MKTRNIKVMFDSTIVEQFNEQEMLVLVGGISVKGILTILKDIFGGGDVNTNNGDCSTTVNNNVPGCGCPAK